MDDRRVDPVTGERSRFRSSIVPPYARRPPKVAEVLPLLYLHGLSTSDFVPALAEFSGSEAGCPAAAITRLTNLRDPRSIERASLHPGRGTGLRRGGDRAA
ncbi:MAG: hypothetical protein KatS3mg013_1186 [Actinomycetota bacterium]|nr:MAG: hypothetical protein KatS3mg013_1186 [Actinomycetota bacterium]